MEPRRTQSSALPGWRRAAGLAATVVLATTGTSASAATLTPLPVRADPHLAEATPSADGPWLSWAQTTRHDPSGYTVFAKKGPQPRIKISLHSTAEFDGWSYAPDGGGLDGGTLVYTEPGRYASYDLYTVDLRTHRRTRLPKAVNTEAFEAHPTISGDWILFYRDHGGFRSEVLLYNVRTHAMRVLAKASDSSISFVDSGQVNGRYAVWERVASKTSDVYLYDIRTQITTKIPRPPDYAYQSVPSVGVDGTMYYERSGPGCGYLAELVRYPIGGPPESLYSFPAGQDMGTTFVDDARGGARTVYAEDLACTSRAITQRDVVKFADSFGLTLTLRGTGTGTVTSAPAGITCGTTCEQNYPRRLDVTLTATPDPGSVVTGWSIAACGAHPTCTVRLRTTERVTVTFTGPPPAP